MAELFRLKKYAGLLPAYSKCTKLIHFMGGAPTDRELIKWSFPNGYGASLVSGDGNIAGRYAPEFAVLRHGALCYSTDITSDVIPYATVSDVALYLARIRGF